MNMLISCQVERALRSWTTGRYNPTKKAFSGDNYASRIELYSRMISGMKEKQWEKILSDCSRVVDDIIEEKRKSGELAESDCPSGSEMASEMLDPADLAAMDADSDLDI